MIFVTTANMFCCVICMREVESIMNVEKSNFIPIRIKNYILYIYIYIYIYCLKAIIIRYVVGLLTNNDFSKAKYALIVDDYKTC